MEQVAQLRLMAEKDIPQRVAALNSRSVLDGVLIEYPVSEAETAKWLIAATDSESRRDFVYSLGDQVIGFSGLVNINRTSGTAELYIFMLEEFQGAGNGLELLRRTLCYAAAEANLRKISLYVSASNGRAARFYERAGFNREGVLKQHAWHRGSYVDRYIYSIFLDSLEMNVLELYPKSS